MGRIRLLPDLSLEVEHGVGSGRLFRGVAEMVHRLGVSEGWMLDLFVAGSWIPSLLGEDCRRRWYQNAE